MNKNIIIVNDSLVEKFKKSGALVRSPMDYILGEFERDKKYHIFNLSSNMGYQEKGYYVSLLAEARKDKIFPSARCIQDLNDKRINKVLSEDINTLTQANLRNIKSDKFELSIYFGKNITSSYNKLSWELFRLVQAPLFRVFFEKKNSWEIKKISLLRPSEISEYHLDFLIESSKNYFEEGKFSRSSNSKYKYDLAILYDENEVYPPSDKKAIKNFVNAFQKNGIKTYLIQNSEKPDINNYDALFIRETTNVTHHTYRLSRSAEIERLVVIDDPDSIVRCTNKIYLEQLLERLKIKRPRTIILDPKKYAKGHWEIKFPCVIKKPDSAFSQGVHKASTVEELDNIAKELFKKTELLLIQEYVPTDFDWRVGILNGEILYVCKYFMAKGHWQIINNKDGKFDEGGFECIDPISAPEKVIKIALKVASEIGIGLYGVDLKQKGEDIYFIEINDNPSIEAGVEDKLLGDELYDRVAKFFLRECNRKRGIHV
ncbi:MAG: RimK family protein [Halobacteriovoraceae bacterium]|nr:RimK family protein [Halobacteriovoraceae bacterium]